MTNCMKRYCSIVILFIVFSACSFAQTLEQAREMLNNGEYEAAKPVFERFVKSQPNNGNYNLWYGICCLNTGEAEQSVSHLEIAVKRKVPSGQLHLGQAYIATYRFDEAVSTFEAYISDLNRLKRPTEEATELLEKSKAGARMIKGVEKVCIIDSVVVNKTNFLSAYKISEESGQIYTYNDFFDTEEFDEGTVYETELGNKAYYSRQTGEDGIGLFTMNKLQDKWTDGTALPENINSGSETNYPFVLSDGTTVYYASNNGSSLGGYDIFVTRYNSESNSYFTPENIGMPFNSPDNDYMYVIDEFNNLGWFATDRNQPADTVCIYIFIPNASRIAYNYEEMEGAQIRNLARLNSIESTWYDEDLVEEAKQRLQEVMNQPVSTKQEHDFVFIINDRNTYYTLTDFRSANAKNLFNKHQQMSKDYAALRTKLNQMREEYAAANQANQAKQAPAIIDLEQRINTMLPEIEALATSIRNEEIKQIK